MGPIADEEITLTTETVSTFTISDALADVVEVLLRQFARGRHFAGAVPMALVLAVFAFESWNKQPQISGPLANKPWNHFPFIYRRYTQKNRLFLWVDLLGYKILTINFIIDRRTTETVAMDVGSLRNYISTKSSTTTDENVGNTDSPMTICL